MSERAENKAPCGCYVEIKDGRLIVTASAFTCSLRHNQGDSFLGTPTQADIDRGEELAKEHGW